MMSSSRRPASAPLRLSAAHLLLLGLLALGACRGTYGDRLLDGERGALHDGRVDEFDEYWRLPSEWMWELRGRPVQVIRKRAAQARAAGDVLRAGRLDAKAFFIERFARSGPGWPGPREVGDSRETLRSNAILRSRIVVPNATGFALFFGLARTTSPEALSAFKATLHEWLAARPGAAGAWDAELGRYVETADRIAAHLMLHQYEAAQIAMDGVVMEVLELESMDVLRRL